MSRNRPSPLRAMRARLPRVLESALTAFLYAAGLLLPLCSALALPVGAADMLLACAGFSLLLALFALSPLTALLGAAGALLSLLPYALRLPAQLPGLTQALVLAAQGAPLALRLYAGTLYPLLALLFVLLAFVLSHASGGFYPALALAAFVLLAAWFYGARGDVLLCLPALAALVLLYAHAGEHGATILRALPTALTAALLAALLMPAAAPVSSAMSDFAERVRSVVYDYFFFTEPRTVFSLLLSGYQPLGADQLGGPANPTDDLVLRVQTGETVYLRGVVKNEYTGTAWRDTVAGRRYLFIDPRYRTLRDGLFDASLPAQDLRTGDAAFDERAVTVELLADGTSTLFVPQRLTNISSAEGFQAAQAAQCAADDHARPLAQRQARFERTVAAFGAAQPVRRCGASAVLHQTQRAHEGRQAHAPAQRGLGTPGKGERRLSGKADKACGVQRRFRAAVPAQQARLVAALPRGGAGRLRPQHARREGGDQQKQSQQPRPARRTVVGGIVRRGRRRRLRRGRRVRGQARLRRRFGGRLRCRACDRIVRGILRIRRGCGRGGGGIRRGRCAALSGWPLVLAL